MTHLFFEVSARFRDDKKLVDDFLCFYEKSTLVQKKIIRRLFFHYRNSDICDVSQSIISREVGCALRYCRKILHRVRDQGFISWREFSSQARNVYEIRPCLLNLDLSDPKTFAKNVRKLIRSRKFVQDQEEKTN